MLKTVKFELDGQMFTLSAISALDYLEYIEYMNTLDKPELVLDSDDEQELNRKLNKITRNNLMAHTRLIAHSLLRAGSEKTIDELQNELLNNWSHSDVFRTLEAVQDVCEFPRADSSDEELEADNGELKNV